MSILSGLKLQSSHNPLLSLWENTNAESLSELPSPCFAYKLELLLENKSSKLDYIKVSELC
jgi:hypothetical protein